MKTKIHYSFVILLMIFANLNKVFSQEINPKIQEVYGTKLQELVINEPEHLARLNDLLENRIKVIVSDVSPVEKYLKLSQVALLNKYNSSLTRDVVFNPADFNPLKYDLVFFPKEPMVYRVDGTNYLIVINPQILK